MIRGMIVASIRLAQTSQGKIQFGEVHSGPEWQITSDKVSTVPPKMFEKSFPKPVKNNLQQDHITTIPISSCHNPSCTCFVTITMPKADRVHDHSPSCPMHMCRHDSVGRSKTGRSTVWIPAPVSVISSFCGNYEQCGAALSLPKSCLLTTHPTLNTSLPRMKPIRSTSVFSKALVRSFEENLVAVSSLAI